MGARGRGPADGGVVGGNHYFLTGGEIVENEKIEKILAPQNSGFPWTPAASNVSVQPQMGRLGPGEPGKAPCRPLGKVSKITFSPIP